MTIEISINNYEQPENIKGIDMCSKVLLIGNSFPLSLIRRPVEIAPIPMAELQALAHGARLVSFWGHANTLAAARESLGFDVTPATSRPVLLLDDAKLPSLEGISFQQCYVLSPDYRAGFRPDITVEVAAEDILGWQVLRIEWK